MDFPDPGIELGSSALQVDSLPTELSVGIYNAINITLIMVLLIWYKEALKKRKIFQPKYTSIGLLYFVYINKIKKFVI